jgi:hypothetical protein
MRGRYQVDPARYKDTQPALLRLNEKTPLFASNNIDASPPKNPFSQQFAAA